MGLEQLSEYERRAWDALGIELAARGQAREHGAMDAVRGRLRGVNRSVASRATKVLDRLPADRVEGVLRQTISGLRALTLDPAIASVGDGPIRDHYVDLGHPVGGLHEIRSIDLEVVDRGLPHLGVRYMFGMGLEGALSAGAVTGAELLASAETVGTGGVGAAPGAATVLAAIAADAATLVAGSARLVARTAAFHGYPVSTDEAKVEALATLSFGMAGAGAAKVVAYRELSTVTQQLARRAAWEVLNESVLVRVMGRVYAELGFKLTQRKLGQLIPVAGVVIGAGLNASFARQIAEDARFGIEPASSQRRPESTCRR